MIVPLVLAGVLALVGFHFGKPKKRPTVTSGGYLPVRTGRADVAARTRARTNARPCYTQLHNILRMGGNPPMQLLQAAWVEAYRAGDVQSVAAIEQYCLQNQEAQEPQVVTGQELGTAESDGADGADGADGEGGEGEGGPEGWGESVAATITTHHHGQTPQEQAAAPMQPPVSPAIPYPNGWDKFCAALRTRDAGYQSDNYLGAYEHNRRRLRQLGISEKELASPEAQHKAFCRDMDSYRDGCTKLIAEWTGKALDVNGQVHSVTPSGILGLLKAAGPRGAEGWLRNPADRTAFPTTTEVFARCNGCF